MSPLLLALLAVSAVSLLLVFVAHLSLWGRLRARGAAGRNVPLPPISVLKPLKGLDEALFENLASLARQDYPGFELVLGAEDPCDPALEVARRLRQAFPSVSIQIVAGAAPFGMNPKVRNLVSLSARARHEHWLISDANVRVGPTYLRELAGAYAPDDVGLVHSLIAGVGHHSLGALFENLHLNGFVAPMVAGAQTVAGVPTVIGKSMLFRGRDLVELGGWARVRDVLAEDYVLGRAFQSAGWTVGLCAHPIQTVNQRWPVSRFIERHLRWAQMRRHISPAAFVGELFANPTLWLFALGAVSAVQGSPAGRVAAVLGIAAKVSLDAAAMALLQRRRPGLGVLAAPLKDLLIAAVWPIAALKRTVCWRGNPARITAGSVLVPIAPPAPVVVEAQPAREVA